MMRESTIKRELSLYNVFVFFSIVVHHEKPEYLTWILTFTDEFLLFHWKFFSANLLVYITFKLEKENCL
jgi:hypothetical protein